MYKKQLVAIIFGTITIFGFGYGSIQNYLHYQDQCANKDVLSWDANIRMIQTIDQYQAIKHGKILQGLLPFFAAPTWPPLRNMIALPYHLITPGGLDPAKDIYISQIFWVFAFLIIPVLAFEISHSIIAASVIWLFSTMALVYSTELVAYSFSSMLETQGIFFTLLIGLYVYRVYDIEINKEGGAMQSPGIEQSALLRPFQGLWRSGLFIATFGLFFTKYPYGLMLIIAMVGIEMVRNPFQFINFIVKYWKTESRLIGKMLLVGFLIAPVVIFLAAKVDFIDLKSKGSRNIIFIIMLMFFIDFNIRIFRKGSAFVLLSNTARIIYINVIFPMAIWLLVNPDRINSTVGTQLHVQEQNRIYLLSYFQDAYHQPWIPLFVSLALIYGVLAVLFQGWNRMSPEEDGNHSNVQLTNSDIWKNLYYSMINNPWFLTLMIFIGQYAVLEILTGNKQLRHIYHLIPVITVVGMAGLIRLLPTKNQFYEYVTLGGMLLVSLAIAAADGLPGQQSYYREREVCFTGLNRADFNIPRTVASHIDPHKQYVVINMFHDLNSDLDGRYLATEFDLLMRMRVISNSHDGILLNDSRYGLRDWSDFNSLLILSSSCTDPQRELFVHERARQMGKQIYLEESFPVEGKNICLDTYRLEKN